MTTFGVIAYVVLAALNVLMARMKRVTIGVGYLVIFFFSLLFTPIPFLLFLLLVTPRPPASAGGGGR